jgi:hypothetical protein
VFVGHDWSVDHHHIQVRDELGGRLERAGLAEGVEGVARFDALAAGYGEDR